MISIDAILASKIFIIHIKILHQTTRAPLPSGIHRLPMGGKIPLAPDDLWGIPLVSYSVTLLVSPTQRRREVWSYDGGFCQASRGVTYWPGSTLVL
jgi:hypothetical protein